MKFYSKKKRYKKKGKDGRKGCLKVLFIKKNHLNNWTETDDNLIVRRDFEEEKIIKPK